MAMTASVRRIGEEQKLAIVVEQLTLRRGKVEVLRDLSLSFRECSVTAVVGPSGVGKTTLVSAINGLLLPEKGRIVVSGIGALDNPAALKAARHRIATIFQDHALIGRLSAIDNVLLGLADMRHPLSPLPWPGELRLRAAEALEQVGLLDKAAVRADQLSGGERQRVGIARALIRKPVILLGDEPFASVDPVLAQRLAENFKSLITKHGITVILVLHQLQMARALADRIVGLSGGRIAFDGPAADFDVDAEARIFSPAQKAGSRAFQPQEEM
jgi:phosphonate transport system ATP-binding protein